MTIELANYWAQLTGSVHPCDTHTFADVVAHGFNLDFPPPAFIGDIVHAPVIILDNNGGYNENDTPKEFPDAEAHDEYRRMLAAPRPLDPLSRSVSQYYLQRNYSEWLISGKAALVNGVAYRSVDGRASSVAQMTRTLPSARFHQHWLRETLAPLAKRGERFIVVHRWGRWNGAAEVLRSVPSVIFSSSSINPNLTAAEVSAAQAFLEGH